MFNSHHTIITLLSSNFQLTASSTIASDRFPPCPLFFSPTMAPARRHGLHSTTILAVAAGALAAGVHGACSVRPDTDIVVYADTAGGAGVHSDAWTRAFFAWWSAGNAPGALNAVFISDAVQLSTYYSTGCNLADSSSYPRLQLYVQPGGDALNASIALGPGGRDNILDFAASGRGHYMGTCAGFFYAAGGYWWEGLFYPNAWMAHWWPTVEGPIATIAAYPAYAPTLLDNGLTMVYYGGPGMGINATTAAVPNGATVLAKYTAAGAAGTPAMLRYNGAYVKALLNSPHPEAQAGVGLTCAAPLPPGCITPAQQLQNWQYLAGQINALLGTSWVIPSAL